MADLPLARSTNSTFCKSQPLVAVFVGATTGIGEYTLRALATAHGNNGKGLRVYVVGRKEEAANQIFKDCREACHDGDFRFVRATDLSLMEDVDKSCETIKEAEAKESSARIDLLVMSHAILHLAPRMETKEGLDTSMSLLYYSRMRFIIQLLPLLLASRFPAHVISVYAAGSESMGKLFADDLDLREPGHYSFSSCRTNVTHMKTMFFEKLAMDHPGKLSLSHIYPGLVVTPAFYSNSHPLWFRVIWRLVAPLVKLLAITPEAIGQRVLFLASPCFPARDQSVGEPPDDKTAIRLSTDGVRGGGAYSCNYNGQIRKVEKNYEQLRKQDFRDKVWKHTMKTFEDIEASRTLERS